MHWGECWSKMVPLQCTVVELLPKRTVAGKFRRWQMCLVDVSKLKLIEQVYLFKWGLWARPHPEHSTFCLDQALCSTLFFILCFLLVGCSAITLLSVFYPPCLFVFRIMPIQSGLLQYDLWLHPFAASSPTHPLTNTHVHPSLQPYGSTRLRWERGEMIVAAILAGTFLDSMDIFFLYFRTIKYPHHRQIRYNKATTFGKN